MFHTHWVLVLHHLVWGGGGGVEPCVCCMHNACQAARRALGMPQRMLVCGLCVFGC